MKTATVGDKIRVEKQNKPHNLSENELRFDSLQILLPFTSSEDMTHEK